MSEKLCSCPFCGSEPRIYETQWAIKCADSLCSVKPSVYSNDRDVAISRWNQRPETEEEKAHREEQNKKNLGQQAIHALVETVAVMRPWYTCDLNGRLVECRLIDDVKERFEYRDIQTKEPIHVD